MATGPTRASQPRRRLSPNEKYELYRSVLTGQLTLREAAERWEVDRSTAAHICRVAKQGAQDALAMSVSGRRGQSAEAAELAVVQKEVERLRATVAEQAAVIHLGER